MALALALLVTYLICLIVAGHGAVPVALLLVSGGVDSWFFPGKIVGLFGIACLATAVLALRPKSVGQSALQLFSSILLYASWFDIARRTDNESGSFSTTFIFSIPFQITFLVVMVWLMLRIKRGLARQRSGP